MPCRSVPSKVQPPNRREASRSPKIEQSAKSQSFAVKRPPLKPLSFEFRKWQRFQSFVRRKRLKAQSFTVTSYQRPPGNGR